jgi:hypothetical protein
MGICHQAVLKTATIPFSGTRIVADGWTDVHQIRYLGTQTDVVRQLLIQFCAEFAVIRSCQIKV